MSKMCIRDRLEFLDSVLYQVFSKYVEIDGVPYVIEMLKTLDVDTPVSYTHLYIRPFTEGRMELNDELADEFLKQIRDASAQG